MSTVPPPHEIRTERLFRGPSGQLLLITVLGNMMANVSRILLPPLLPTIIVDLSISPALAGYTLTVMWGMTALIEYPAGRLSDELSRKTILVSGLGLFVVGLAVLTNSSTFPVFLVGVLIIGAGSGLYPPAAFALISDVFVEKRGQAFGVNGAFFDIGGALASGLAALALSIAMWRLAFLPPVVAVVILLILMHFWINEPYVISRTRLDIRRTVWRIVAKPHVRWVLVAYALFGFAWQGAISFLPTLLQATKGFSPTFASQVFAGIFIIGVVIKPLAGRLSDRLGFLEVISVSSSLTALGLGMLLLADTRLLVLGSVVVVAMGIAAAFPMLTALVMNVVPDSSRGGDFGAARTLFFAVGALGPAFVGTVAEYASYSLAFGGLIVFLIASTAIVVGLLWRRPAAVRPSSAD